MSHLHGQHVPLLPTKLLIARVQQCFQHKALSKVGQRKHESELCPKFSEIWYAFLNAFHIGLLQLPHEQQTKRRVPSW